MKKQLIKLIVLFSMLISISVYTFYHTCTLCGDESQGIEIKEVENGNI